MREIALLLLLLSATSAFAQSSPSTTTEVSGSATVVKNSGTLQLLRQTLQLTGWAQARQHNGMLAQGAYLHLDQQGNELDSTLVTVLVRSDKRAKFTLGTGDSFTLRDQVAVRNRSSVTKAELIPPHAAMSLVSPYFPFFTDLAVPDDPDVLISEAVPQSVNGDTLRGISVKRKYPGTDQLSREREVASPLTLWVSQKTGLPVRLDFVRVASDNWQLGIPYSLYFMNWTQLGGVLIPTQIDEGSGGQVFLRTRFSQISFDDSIPDSEFTTAAGGVN